MTPPVAYVRIGMSDLALDWIATVAVLLETIEDADEAMLEDEIRERAMDVREVMWGYARGYE